MTGDSRYRQHAGAALVAVSIIAVAIAEGTYAPIAYAAASVVIWAAVIAGVLSRALPSASVAPTAVAAGLCLAGLTLLAGLSIGWAGDQGRAFEEAVRTSAYLGMFTLAACSAGTRARAQWLGGLGAGLGVVAVLALLSHLQPGLLEGDELDRLIPTAAGRASYPIGYWNGLGALLASAAILLAWGGLAAPARGLRAAAIATLPLALLTISLTGSRGAGAAAVLGLVLLVAASSERRRQALPVALGAAVAIALIGVAGRMDSLTSDVVDGAMRSDGDLMTAIAALVALATAAGAWLLDGRALPAPALSRRGAVALAAIAAVIAAAAIVAADPVQRFEDFRSAPTAENGDAAPTGEDFNSSGRWQFWDEGVDAFASAPVAGIGAGAFEDWWARNATLPVFVRNPHSLPLQQAAELGLLGLVLLAGFVTAVGLAAWRRLRAGLGGDAGVLVAVIAAASVGAAVDWTWAIPAVAAPALLAAGLLTASAPSEAPVRHRYWLGLGTVAVGWVAVIAAGLVVLGELKLDRSRDAAAAGRVEQGVERALEARTVQPWSPEPYTQLALLEEQRGDLDQALSRLRQAQERDSEDWRLALIEARLQQARGDGAAAAAARRRALELSPVFGG